MAATSAVIVGHDVLAFQLLPAIARTGLPEAARFATLVAALAVHLLTGIFVLPRLTRARAGPSRDAVRVAMVTALAAVSIRAATEAAIGVLVVGLPVFSMAIAVTGTAAAAAFRGSRRRAAFRRVARHAPPAPRQSARVAA